MMSHSTKLFYIVGASGSGKDTILMNFKKRIVSEHLPVVVAHRYITRLLTEKNQETENFISLSLDEFYLRKKQNLFALDWEANNGFYAIGIEINQWMSMGLSVLVNGSRSYLPTARKLFPEKIVTINVDVPTDVLAARLQSRQRETIEEIEARMQRHKALVETLQCDNVIDNTGTITSAVDQLEKIIKHI